MGMIQALRPLLHHRDNLLCHVLQRLKLLGVQGARLVIDHTQGSERMPIGCHKGSTRIETDVGVARYERIGSEARIGLRILDLHRRQRVLYRMRTEGMFTWSFGDL